VVGTSRRLIKWASALLPETVLASAHSRHDDFGRGPSCPLQEHMRRAAPEPAEWPVWEGPERAP
jgi:hypothetical protein